MKKSDLAELQQQASELNQINASNVDALVAILESTFSAIATADPGLAINIIDQLADQKEGIQAVKEEREKKNAAYIRKLASLMPPMIEFDEEDELDREEMT